MAKDLKYFMREKKDEVITVKGPKSFKDDNGQVIDFEIKIISQSKIDKIYDNYTKKSIATDKKGKPIIHSGNIVWKVEKDDTKAFKHIMVEVLSYPDLKNPELMKFYNCVDITEMPELVFPNHEEFDYVSKIIMAALGMGEYPETEETDIIIEEAKN